MAGTLSLRISGGEYGAPDMFTGVLSGHRRMGLQGCHTFNNSCDGRRTDAQKLCAVQGTGLQRVCTPALVQCSGSVSDSQMRQESAMVEAARCRPLVLTWAALTSRRWCDCACVPVPGLSGSMCTPTYTCGPLLHQGLVLPLVQRGTGYKAAAEWPLHADDGMVQAVRIQRRSCTRPHKVQAANTFAQRGRTSSSPASACARLVWAKTTAWGGR